MTIAVERRHIETNLHQRDFHGRLQVITELLDNDRFTLAVGSGETRFGHVNVDINRNVFPDVVTDAQHLPFRSGTFKQIIFTDVIEHLPAGCERKILVDFHRLLKKDGVLILSTPNMIVLFTFLDFYWYTKGHRHYLKKVIEELVGSSGFEIIDSFTAGGMWMAIKPFPHFIGSILFKNKELTTRSSPVKARRSFITSLLDREYATEAKTTAGGYTIFLKAKKISFD